MHMHPFWCGVAATLIVETVGLIAAVVWLSAKVRKPTITRRCGNCVFIVGTILTSYPPKVRCPLTGAYHLLDDTCDC